MIKLAPFLPYGYGKKVETKSTLSLVCAVANGKRENKDIHDQLSMIAMENVLDALLKDNDNIEKYIEGQDAKIEGLKRKVERLERLNAKLLYSLENKKDK